MNRVLAAAARTFADDMSARLEDIPAARLLRADIATVTAGAAGDGNALVTVTWRLATLPVADYPDSYTPIVGHRVLCALADGKLSILHHGIGTS